MGGIREIRERIREIKSLILHAETQERRDQLADEARRLRSDQLD